MLEIKDLHVHYGGIHAVQGVNMRIPRGQIVTLIGANGAGKSSVIRSVAKCCIRRSAGMARRKRLVSF